MQTKRAKYFSQIRKRAMTASQVAQWPLITDLLPFCRLVRPERSMHGSLQLSVGQ